MTERDSSSRTRYLTQKQAEKCEMALEPVCKCRCGGQSHGKGRIAAGGDFSTLPIDDPHYRPPEQVANREAIRKFLRDAKNKMEFPQIVERNAYIREHSFEEWLEFNTKEFAAFHEAQKHIEDALKGI